MAPPNPVLERFQFTARPGTDISKIVKDLISIITNPRPAGFQDGVWGTSKDNVYHVEMWLVWDKIESQTSFLTPEKLAAFKAILNPITTSLPPRYHLTFSQNPLPLLHSPLTEIQTFHGPSSIRFPVSNPHLETPTFNGQLLGKSPEKVLVEVKEGKVEKQEKQERSVVVVVIGWKDGEDGEDSWKKERDVRDGYQFLFRDGEEEDGIERERCWVRFMSF